MAQEFLNVLDPQYTRYIHIRGEIEAYLIEKYGEETGFQVVVRSAFSDRDWGLLTSPSTKATAGILKRLSN